DLINVALAQLHRNQIELPKFSIVDRRVATLRAQAHQQLYDRILARLTNTQKTALDTLLTVTESQQVSHFTQLKEAPGKATLKNLRLWEKRLVWVISLLETEPLLHGMTNTKRKQFAAQAYALELGDIRDIQGHGKRYTLLLCLLHDAQVSTYVQLTTMFLHRIRTIHRNAYEKLKQFREAQLAIIEQIVTTLGEIAHASLDIDDNGKLGALVRATLDLHGGAKQLAQQSELLAVYHDNNYLALMWESYRNFRAVLFRLTDHLSIRSATQDTTVIAALEFLKPYAQSRRKYLPAEIDLSFASQRWQQLVKGKYRRKPVFQRKQLEVCVFHYVAVGLSRGDLFVEGSAEFADYRTQLMTWDQCEPLVAAYCAAVDLPDSADKFVQQLRQGLRETAQRIDAAFPENSDLTIDSTGQPHLTRTPKRTLPEGLDEFKQRLITKMPDRHLLDILKFVQYWVQYTNYFGPPSGNIPKMVSASG
ncbi:MAG: hypothetical protein KAG66_06045, partial [Methylococcales bacterium]|nr:hypothetical protein [Methylococcales bacterium]